MDVIVSGRHCHVSDDVRSQVEDRLLAVDKIRDRVTRAEVVFTAQNVKGSPCLLYTSDAADE